MNHTSLAILSLAMIWLSPLNGAIIFNFSNGSGLDSGGTSMTATDGIDSLTLTTVAVFTPEFIESNGTYSLSGNTVSGETNIGSSGGLGINNINISNANYETYKGSTAGEENLDIDLGETWEFQFDSAVRFIEVNFSGIGDDEEALFTIAGVNYSFLDGTSNDDFTDPFGTLIITAGTPIKMTVNGSNDNLDAALRITSFTLDPIPEPSSALLLLISGVALAGRRKR